LTKEYFGVYFNRKEKMLKKKSISQEDRKKSPQYSPQDLETIRIIAYSIWEKKGKPENHTLDCWLEAERQLKREGRI
jgi:hypothetical protein